MTQKEIELLIKDLSARLPYKVKIYNGGIGKTLDSITIRPDYIEIVIKGTYAYSHFIHKDTGEWDNYDDLARCKPYLRPMSSMTAEEQEELKQVALVDNEGVPGDIPAYIDWLNKNMFDYRGLIPMGLALEAPEGMYKEGE